MKICSFSIVVAIDPTFIRINWTFFIKKYVDFPWKNFVRREKWAEKKCQRTIIMIWTMKFKSFSVKKKKTRQKHFQTFFSFTVNYKKHNDSKNVFAFSRTPTAFISSMVLCYLIAGLLDLIWLGGLNFIFMFAFWVCFVLLCLWLYTKYSGDYPEVGEYIDYFADVIWNNVSRREEKRFFILF